MDDDNKDTSVEDTAAGAVPESPKPLAFTIDFGEDKKIDTHRHKTLAEKFQKRHKRGQSLSKLDESNATATPKHPLSGNLPRKSSFQSEGYFSSDEKPERPKNIKTSAKRSELTLLLRNVTSERMTQSFPNPALPSIDSPQECELKDISSPELDMISPYSPKESEALEIANTSSEEVFIDANEFDFDKNSDAVSDTGTYTLDAENYSEEQKARMSIDRDFKIEEVSVKTKTEEYIQSLAPIKEINTQAARPMYLGNEMSRGIKDLNIIDELKSPRSPLVKPKLSPILSPTQNISIVDPEKMLNNGECDPLNNTFTKILCPSSKAKSNGIDTRQDHGSVISVTSSGAFRAKPEEKKKIERKHSLTKSDVQVQAYFDGRSVIETVRTNNAGKLTANIVNVQSIDDSGASVITGSLVVGKVSNLTSGLPPAIGGKTSPTKIPSPIHTLSRPRSRNSLSSLNVELSDDTEIILKPTQNYINSLQQRLSLDSDPDSDYDAKYGLQLNNTAHLLKQRASHTRHNSLDDRTMNNKLEHFQSKNLQGIDQTYSNLLNQYGQNKVIQKIHNSPNNSPIRRSSSFSTKNQLNPKNTNVSASQQKESNLCNSPNLTSIQRSSSTACIKPNFLGNRRSSITDHRKIDRSQFGDTESSSEDDFEKNLQRRKDLGNISNTRCNRAFSLRRARIDNEPGPLRCPNTPEMRRKAFQTDVKQERAISVDRKPVKTNEVPSRYLNLGKRVTPPPPGKEAKTQAKGPPPGGAKPANKVQAFARTDSGRFSMRTAGKPAGNLPKTPKSGKKEAGGGGKKQPGGGARSNSSLSSREVEFQNWKRRKSYDPMKAAAEGKRRAEQQRRRGGGGDGAAPAHSASAAACADAMARSYAGGPPRRQQRSPDSSPSRSGSVHRSQSFHGTAAMEQLASSDDDDDLTLSADEGFSPPTPSPCELSPARATLRHRLWERLHN